MWLLAHPDTIPNDPTVMADLLQRGATTWRALCANETLAAQFPDGHFEFETVLAQHNASVAAAAKDPPPPPTDADDDQATIPPWLLKPLHMCQDKSMVGFLRPQQGVCAALDGLLDGSLTDITLWEV